jgi:hypothetical protein
LLIGDSQAGSMSDGVFGATELLNLSFVVWYNNGCPIFPRPTEERSDCADFQKSIPELISSVKPDLIVVANKASLYGMGGGQHGGLSIKNADGSTPNTYSETIQMWTDGIQEMFSSAPFVNSKILYIQQVPTSKPNSPTLIKKASDDSTFDLNFSSSRNEIVQDEKQALGSFNNVTLFNPADYLCPDNRCTASIDGNSVYSDENHLSPYGANLLAPSIGQVIKQLLNI